MLDNYDNIKNIINQNAKIPDYNKIYVFLEDKGKNIQNLFFINFFVSSYYFIEIENIKNSKSIGLLLPKIKLDNNNDAKKTILNEIQKSSFNKEIPKYLRIKTNLENCELEEKNKGNFYIQFNIKEKSLSMNCADNTFYCNNNDIKNKSGINSNNNKSNPYMNHLSKINNFGNNKADFLTSSNIFNNKITLNNDNSQINYNNNLNDLSKFYGIEKNKK